LIDPYYLLGVIDLAIGNYQPARHHLHLALNLVNKYGHMVGGAILAYLCEVEFRQGNWVPAVDLCKDYIRLAKKVQTPFNVFERMEMIARIYARQKRNIQAAHLSGAAEALSEKYGRLISSKSRDIIIPDWRTRSPEVALDRLIPEWSSRPDGEQIQQAWDEGRAMTYEEAIEYALNLEGC
jgi:tetratricopeptide (TPR) repeat protein